MNFLNNFKKTGIAEKVALLAGVFVGVVFTVYAIAIFIQSFHRPYADMTGYGLDKDNKSFFETTIEEFSSKVEDGDTFVIYLGFENCPWCKEAVPILNKVAEDTNSNIGYIDLRKDSSWTSNLDIDDYDMLVEKIGDYLEYDENGIKHLYAPTVIFVKNGEIVGFHSGTVDGHDATEREMTDEEKQELYDVYNYNLQLLLEGEN